MNILKIQLGRIKALFAHLTGGKGYPTTTLLYQLEHYPESMRLTSLRQRNGVLRLRIEPLPGHPTLSHYIRSNRLAINLEPTDMFLSDLTGERCQINRNERLALQEAVRTWILRDNTAPAAFC